MLTRSIRWNLALSVLLVVAMGACGSAGGCGACSAAQPLPGGSLPATQTVEGGAQIRVTPQGFSKLTGLVEPLLNQGLSSGFCVPQGNFGTPTGGTLATGASYCSGHPSNTCSPGCLVDVALNQGGLTTSVKDAQTLNLKLATTVSSTVHLNGQVIGIGFSCTLGVSSNNLTADLDVALATDPTTGELSIKLAKINSVGLNLDFSGCGPVSSIANLATTIINAFAGDFVTNLLTPTVGNAIQSFLPKPLGLVGQVDLGSALSSFSPGTQAMLETRIVPGGYVQLSTGGLSLGVITGINADRDPSTRGGSLASEPALCAPPLPPPNLSAAPTSLPLTSRGTFKLGVADALNGVPSDPAADLAMGISQTTLNLAGHHLVSSGALCLGIGSSTVQQLNVGTIALLVPSLGELASEQGNDPLLLVTRPQRPLTFAIGDNTDASPAVTVGVSHLQVDFYAFLLERYVRAFTLDVSMNVGVNADLEQPPGMPATVKPTLVGIAPQNVQITVLDSEFIRESPAQLEAVLPSVLSLVTPLIANLPTITVPSFANFQIESPSIHHVSSSQDDFLAIYAQLGPSAQMQALASGDPRMTSALAALARPQVAVAASTGTARVLGIVTPEPEVVRAALMGAPGGRLPSVTFDADAYDATGRPLEWSYQLDGGMWRPWRTGAPLVIEDQAFAWQGKYVVGLRSRVVGDNRTESESIQLPVIIDSAPPRIAVDKASLKGDSGDTYAIPAFDVVSGNALQYAFGRPNGAPESAWIAGDTVELTRETANAYAAADGQLAVFVKDESGNMARALVAPFGPQTGGCAVGGGAGLGSLLLVGALLALGRRRRARAGGGALAALALLGCGSKTGSTMQPPPSACESSSDCALPCPSNDLNFCIDGACVCSDDIPVGRVGTYSDVAVGPDGTIWVSAYAQTHGDLVVAQSTGGRIDSDSWEWVDGVPAGPVTVPGSKIRGGVADDGPDVGLYTSIAISPDGTPMVSYFDRDTASLKLAQRIAGVWQTQVVDAGTGQLGDTGALVGMYTAITLRSDDGRPGIAYLANVKDASGARAEVRFASAQAVHPTSPADWLFTVVDSAPLPATSATSYPLPDGDGLFIHAARMANQAPVVAYYDRSNLLTKLAKLDVSTGKFSPMVIDSATAGPGISGIGGSPSVAVDASGAIHVAYVSVSTNSLKYVTVASAASAAPSTPQVIDDGYRIDGTTVDGVAMPVFHFVGADAGLVMLPGGAPAVVYQDATTQELLLAQQTNGTWTHTSIAGATMPWPGAYGFFASAALGKSQLVMSSFVVDLPAGNGDDSNWVEVFTRPLAAQ